MLVRGRVKGTRACIVAIRWRDAVRFVTLVFVSTEGRRELAREVELRAYDILSAEDIPALEHIVDLAAAACGMTVSEINVVTSTDVVHVATTNRDHLTVPRAFSFCSTVIERDQDNVVVTDARQTPPFSTSPYVTGEKARIRSYASSRLTAPSGVTIGTLCVFDEEEREVTEEQLSTLRTLARLVMEVLELRRSHRELAASVSRLAESHHELHDSNESLQAFAGQISHDLQQPLATLEMALELLDDEAALTDEAQQLLEHARTSGRRMSRTITDLLDFALVGTGSPPVPVDVGSVVRDVLADLAAGLSEAKVEVDPLPAVLGHESEVRAVLQNLIANAVKFSAPYGVPQVRITGTVSEAVAAGLPMARITVADNGPGIPEAQREAVFGLAVRGETEVEGHGIGLATCARIVRARGGRIGVEQAASGGAAFWFELPAVTPR